MVDEDNRHGVAAELRRQAEEFARGSAGPSPEGLASLESLESPESLEALSPEAARKTLHELRVHQIELEMQNEELRRAQVERDAAKTRYFDLYDLAPVGYCTFSERGVIVEANLTAATLLGVARSALVGQPISRFILKEDQDLYYFLRKHLFATGAPQAGELRMVKQDGTLFWAHLAATAAKGEDGVPMGRLVLHDVTERKQAEAALQKNATRLSRLFDSDLIGIIFANGERIQKANDVFLDIVGYTRGDLEAGALQWREMTPPEWAASDERGLQELLSRGSCTPFEKEYFRKDGSRVAIFIGAALLEKEPLEWVCFVQDITERKRSEKAQALLEARLRESQKMEAIGTLAGGIAHDFNNILATILGNVELARQDLSASPLALESVEEIRKAGSRARNLVQQILSFSRRQPTARKPTVLAPVVEEAVRLLRATLEARLALEVHCDAEVPVVLADANQVKQVLVNLATNAMQAIRVGPGHIGIRLDTVKLDAALAKSHPALGAMHARRPGQTVRIAVTDDGDGMDAATLGKAFEPFFTTRAVNEGTGLGLSVVHGIVQAHEGAIVVESEPGKGSTVTVYLPAAKAIPDRAAQVGAPGVEESAGAKAAEPASVGSAGAGGGQHILYVDDDESLVFLVDRLLQRRGFRVSAFTNQRAALDALRADAKLFDLVVTDYNMPGMSGLDVAREVRAIRADLPVAVASGFVDEALRAQADAAGVRKLIFKADAAEDLCEAFARLAGTVGTGRIT